ncbi:hypothetical protein Tco_0579356 [Tanacetum coccineum]
MTLNNSYLGLQVHSHPIKGDAPFTSNSHLKFSFLSLKWSSKLIKEVKRSPKCKREAKKPSLEATRVAPPSPDYVPSPEYPPSPDFVPKSIYLEFIPPKDEVLLTEEQPLPGALSPTADSPGYVPESDPEDDPEEDDDEDLEEDPADYPADGGDYGDDEDESPDDDEDDDVNIKGDEEEEEHPTPADSTVVALPAVEHAPSAEETKPFECHTPRRGLDEIRVRRRDFIEHLSYKA